MKFDVLFDDFDFPYVDDPREDGGEDIELKYLSIGRETKLARIVVFEITKTLDNVEFWLPKSQTSLGPDNTIWVPRWLVEQNDLWAYEK